MIAASLIGLSVLLGAGVSRGQGETFFPVGPPRDPNTVGIGVQRTMRLLATSTANRRHHVKILFYGQSITEQDWSRAVAADIRTRFPFADLEIENRAIGGFASQLLKMPAEHDLYPFYPDLVIFHVYGSHIDYESIIQQIRSRTTAEVLMQKDHATAWPDPTASETRNKGMWWDGMMNNTYLPAIAKKYGCALLDNRTAWLDYLTSNHLQPHDLLKDGVHLNDHGNYLMARLIERDLVYRPELAHPADQSVKLTKFRTKDWHHGHWMGTFVGNRVDALFEGPPLGEIQVLVDGKRPSDILGVYVFDRPKPNPWSPLALVRVNHQAALVEEDWKMTITDVSADGKQWSYRVVGSRTGADGAGSNREAFRSPSGRINIDPEFFYHAGAVPVGCEITWRSHMIGTDTVSPSSAGDLTSDRGVILAQGLSNGPHTLEFVAPSGAGIAAIRTYRPPVG